MNDNDRKILWKCRRGMLELDLIFTSFYQNQFSHLTPTEKKIFDELLNEFDPILADWIFIGKPSPPHFSNLLTKLLQFYRVREVGCKQTFPS